MEEDVDINSTPIVVDNEKSMEAKDGVPAMEFKNQNHSLNNGKSSEEVGVSNLNIVIIEMITVICLLAQNVKENIITSAHDFPRIKWHCS